MIHVYSPMASTRSRVGELLPLGNQFAFGYTHFPLSRLESAGSLEARSYSRSYGIVGIDERTGKARRPSVSNQLELKIQASCKANSSDQARRMAKDRAQQMLNATKASSSKVCHNGVISPESKFMQWW